MLHFRLSKCLRKSFTRTPSLCNGPTWETETTRNHHPVRLVSNNVIHVQGKSRFAAEGIGEEDCISVLHSPAIIKRRSSITHSARYFCGELKRGKVEQGGFRATNCLRQYSTVHILGTNLGIYTRRDSSPENFARSRLGGFSLLEKKRAKTRLYKCTVTGREKGHGR